MITSNMKKHGHSYCGQIGLPLYVIVYVVFSVISCISIEAYKIRYVYIV